VLIENSLNILRIDFNTRIDYSIISSYDKVINGARRNSFKILELCFKKTKFITLPGAMYIMFIVYAIVNTKERDSQYVETRILNCSEAVLSIISSFGLLNILKFYGNLKLESSVSRVSEFKYNYWKRVLKDGNYNSDSIFWPISIIPPKASNDFESSISSFINGFIDYFNILVQNNMVENINEKGFDNTRKDFIRAVNESTKNVWDHSESWGAASIFSSRREKSTFCLFDYGIGFINSYIKRKGTYERTIDNDKRILQWLFVEGNTSNDDNNLGRGLPRIAKFVETSRGVMLIKTDKYILKYDYKKGLEIINSEYFPGTQIMINF
jgi:hypothetical protein